MKTHFTATQRRTQDGIWHRFTILLLAFSIQGLCVAADGFFRLVSTAETAFVAIQHDGIAVWSNTTTGQVGVLVRRATSLSITNDWTDYTRVQVTNGMTACRLFAPNCPSGMVYIPPGIFVMGDALGDGGLDEQPLHEVEVSPYFMDQHEVTGSLWQEVTTWAVTNGYAFSGAGVAKGDAHPIQDVLWFDAIKWCNARSEKNGLTPAYYTSTAMTNVYRSGQIVLANACVRWDSGYRLPTEAEWERAARGGASGRRFPWLSSDTIEHSRANYFADANLYGFDVSPSAGVHPAFDVPPPPYTSPSGSFEANAYGLYDLVGNAWEWCWDRYRSTYYSASPEFNPRGPDEGDGSYRVCRGGNWGAYAGQCRIAYRGWASLGFNQGVGFRCVLPAHP